MSDVKFFNEMTKAELAISFVKKSDRIKELKDELKQLLLDIEPIEDMLLQRIGIKYQPKGENFILMPKVTKGRKSTLFKNVVESAPEVCSLTTKQVAIFKDLVTKNTKIGDDKVSIQIVQ